MVPQPGSVKRLWWRWKSLKFPWRKRWLVGFDLKGNTFWEFTDQINIGRIRRIVDYPQKVHLSDVNLSPQWVQWLRHTRFEPPSINEQQLDEVRRAQMKQLAAQADARWAAKASALDGPSKRRPLQKLPNSIPAVETIQPSPPQKQTAQQTEEVASGVPVTHAQQEEGAEVAVSQQPSRAKKDFTGYKLGKEGEQAPDSWVPKPAPRRR